MTQVTTKKNCEQVKRDCSDTIKVYFAPSLTSAGNSQSQISEEELHTIIRKNLSEKGTKVGSIQEVLDLLLHKKK